MTDPTTFVFPEPLETDELRLRSLTAEGLDAWVLGDARALEDLTGARVHGPASPPPLVHEDLPYIRDRLRDDPTGAGWWVWIVLRRSSAEPVGIVVLGGPPEDGVVSCGYSIYPALERFGYATEAVEGLLAWTFAQPGVRVVRSAIPAAHAASIRVAESVGMRATGIVPSDPEFGDIVVFERAARRETADVGG